VRYKNLSIIFFRFVTKHAFDKTDGPTDGRTDRRHSPHYTMRIVNRCLWTTFYRLSLAWWQHWCLYVLKDRVCVDEGYNWCFWIGGGAEYGQGCTWIRKTVFWNMKPSMQYITADAIVHSLRRCQAKNHIYWDSTAF